MESALNSKVSLTGDETIYGTKTFTTSPVVMNKSTATGNNPREIATEAQVYEVVEVNKSHIDDLLSGKVSLTGAETIDGLKTFTASPIVPSKDTAAGDNPAAIATEAQVVKTVNDELAGDQTISGKWTFAVSPRVPPKDTAVSRGDSTVIVTEAQVYKTLMCWNN
jgi:hypothetical protein